VAIAVVMVAQKKINHRVTESTETKQKAEERLLFKTLSCLGGWFSLCVLCGSVVNPDFGHSAMASR